jgi:Arc/MetJ family transcription regulator
VHAYQEGSKVRTTMNLDDRLIKELMEVTGARSRTEAVHQAIAELVRRKKLEELKALSGKVRIADNWRALEAAELGHQAARERHARRRR